MTAVRYETARCAAMLFFITPGLSYGLFTSRLPFFKMATGAEQSDIGLLLLTLGAASVVGLVLASAVIPRFGIRSVLVPGLFGQLMALVAAGTATTLVFLIATFAFLGIFIGLTDVAMNQQGLELERRFHKPTMGTLHAGYAIGGILGSLLGALFARLDIGPFLNFLLPAAGLGLALFWAIQHILEISRSDKKEEKAPKEKLPWLLFFTGGLVFLAFEAEGACGDWGGLFLVKDKGATESAAALTYGTLTAAALVSRLTADRLRGRTGDFSLLFAGAGVALMGIVLVLAASETVSALTGFALAGLGLGPIVPMLYSLTGKMADVSSARASSVLSLMGYSGLLFCPPLYGWVAQYWDYPMIFVGVIVMLTLLVIGLDVVRRRFSQSSDECDGMR